MKTFIRYAAVLCLTCQLAQAQIPGWKVVSENLLGTLNPSLLKMACDSRGNLWFANGLTTSTSVSLFNEDGFEVSQDSILVNLAWGVWGMAADPQDVLWLATDGSGLLRYDGISASVYNTSNSGIKTNSILSIAIDKSGIIWLGTDRGLIRYDGREWFLFDHTNSPLPRNNHIRSVAIDPLGKIWCGLGLEAASYIMSYDGTSWTSFLSNVWSPPLYPVEYMTSSLSGEMWFQAGAGGIHCIRADTITSFGYGGINSLVVDDCGGVWAGTGWSDGFGTGGQGLLRYDGKDWTVFNKDNSPLPGNNILGLTKGHDGTIRVVAMDETGWWGPIYVVSIDPSVVTAAHPSPADLPDEFSLDQNYPNPFNPTTDIGFRIQDRRYVRVSVFDVLGREVAVLVDRELSPGSHTTTWNANGMTSGLYFYRLEVRGEKGERWVETKKMMLVR